MRLRLPRRTLAAAALGACRRVSAAARAVVAEPGMIRRLAAGSAPEELAATVAAQRTQVAAGLAARGTARP